MANHHHTPISVAAEDVMRAETTWTNFTKLMKICIGAAIVVLALMALFLV